MSRVGPGGPTPQTLAPVTHAGVKKVTEAATLEVFEQVVSAVVDGANYNITLPAVSRAKGRLYTFHADVATAHAATVVDAGDSIVSVSEALDTDEELLALYSDGRQWFKMATA